MNAKIQIICLLVSFLYGMLIFLFYKINNIITKKQKRFYRSLITMLFIYNIVLLYIIIIFKINNGSFHLYFFLMMILGICFTYKYQVIIAKPFLRLAKKLKKWYTEAIIGDTYEKKNE